MGLLLWLGGFGLARLCVGRGTVSTTSVRTVVAACDCKGNRGGRGEGAVVAEKNRSFACSAQSSASSAVMLAGACGPSNDAGLVRPERGDLLAVEREADFFADGR